MGTIFLHGGLSTRQIPDRSSFRSTEAALIKLVSDPLFASGLLFGSLASGNPNARSDVDVLLIAEERRLRQAIIATYELRRRVAQEFCVPLNVHLVGRAAAEAGRHGVSICTYQHLAEAGKQLGKRSALDDMRNPVGVIEEEVISYLVRKRLDLEVDLDAWPELGEPARAKALQKALDRPVHAARKMIQAISYVLAAGRDDVLERFEQTFSVYGSFNPCSKSLRALIETDAKYSAYVLNDDGFSVRRSVQHVMPDVYADHVEKLWQSASTEAWNFYTAAIAAMP